MLNLIITKRKIKGMINDYINNFLSYYTNEFPLEDVAGLDYERKSNEEVWKMVRQHMKNYIGEKAFKDAVDVAELQIRNHPMHMEKFKYCKSLGKENPIYGFAFMSVYYIMILNNLHLTDAVGITINPHVRYIDLDETIDQWFMKVLLCC